jgi:hypothetical protein
LAGPFLHIMDNLLYSQEVKSRSTTALILLTYRRLEYFNETVKCINNQTNKDFDLYISNNSSHEEKLLKGVKKRLGNSALNVYVKSYYNQFKAFSRFLIAEELAHEGYEKIIFIDDDEVLPATFIQDCHDQYEDDAFKSFYGHIIKDNYWKKQKLKLNQLGNYAGTGGLVCPAKFFLDEYFFSCPEEFYIIDDLWLSYYILQYTDYKIKLLDTNIEFIRDLKATSIGLKEVKHNFALDFLIPASKHAGLKLQ